MKVEEGGRSAFVHLCFMANKWAREGVANDGAAVSYDIGAASPLLHRRVISRVGEKLLILEPSYF